MERLLKLSLTNGRFEHLTPKRSQTMAAIRGKGNKTTEQRLRMALVRKGVGGFVLHRRQIPGNPDLYFARERLAVFVDGCFWHGCKRCGHIPKSNSSFWALKIQRNKERDRSNRRKLISNGTTVLRFWEHQLAEDLEACVASVAKNLSIATNKTRTKAAGS